MLDTFAGNSSAKETLLTAVKSGRFPHAVIIEGEPGSGRHTFARLFAAAAVCEEQNAPCGHCRSCTLCLTDGHCDVLTYAPDGATFKVDTVRKIRDNAFIYPVEAKRKVNILLDCDKMNESAQNALLKVLEEPPTFMVFILICQNAAALLPTVRSRCVTVSIQNPELDTADNYILTASGKPEEDIRSALLASHGNIGNALAILDGAENKANENAALFLEAVKGRDRLGGVKLLFSYEKERIGFSLFLAELKLLLCSEIKSSALGDDDGRLAPSKLSAILELVEGLDKKIKDHIGQPLQLSLLTTCLCAEIFEQL